jgi:phage terminase Nu1 subunit (DNA packaging protein)
MAKLSLSAISQLLKLTERRIQQLAKDEIIPKAQRGEYEMIPCVHGYIDYLKAKIGREFTAEDLAINRNRLLKAQADLAEIEKQKQEGELIAKQEVKKNWLSILSVIKSKLLSMPNKVAPVVMTYKNVNEVKLILKDKIYDTLHEIAGADLTQDDKRNGRSHKVKSKPIKTSSDSNNKQVGR